MSWQNSCKSSPFQTTTLQFKPQLKLSFSNIPFLHIDENHENKIDVKINCGVAPHNDYKKQV
jgi:hypothetical protein